MFAYSFDDNMTLFSNYSFSKALVSFKQNRNLCLAINRDFNLNPGSIVVACLLPLMVIVSCFGVGLNEVMINGNQLYFNCRHVLEITSSEIIH